jgi:hypothetical protein
MSGNRKLKKINIHRNKKITKIKVEALKECVGIDISVPSQKYITLNKDGSHPDYYPCQVCIWFHIYNNCCMKWKLDKYIDNVKSGRPNLKSGKLMSNWN